VLLHMAVVQGSSSSWWGRLLLSLQQHGKRLKLPLLVRLLAPAVLSPMTHRALMQAWSSASQAWYEQ
jgi:hypothetical protein